MERAGDSFLEEVVLFADQIRGVDLHGSGVSNSQCSSALTNRREHCPHVGRCSSHYEFVSSSTCNTF